ncbi:MAG: hypothetical protein LBU87_01525 [Lactobacillales bacterium]|jgi:ssDNA-binding Zn-finger/Zn-ribbon topoisomerase 1|nr:hypothetical protein [Lactobacillales bacterium]
MTNQERNKKDAIIIQEAQNGNINAIEKYLNEGNSGTYLKYLKDVGKYWDICENYKECHTTLLNEAIKGSQITLIRFLLLKKQNVLSEDSEGRNALAIAMTLKNEYGCLTKDGKKIMQILVDYCAKNKVFLPQIQKNRKRLSIQNLSGRAKSREKQ